MPGAAQLDVPREYVLLALRLGRLAEGLVDAYTGDPALPRAVADEPVADPLRLGDRADELRAALPAAGLPAGRARFLDGQLAALAVTARRLSGRAFGYLEEIETCFQVRPRPADPEVYAAAHRELDQLLPGRGPLAERLAAYRAADEVPPSRLGEVLTALASGLRAVVAGKFGLPQGERVDFALVTDQPWSALHRYSGELCSEVAVSTDVPARMAQLPGLVAHEAYPGHHTEHCRKASRTTGAPELTVFCLNTPQCLVAEGLAENALAVALGAGWGTWAAEVYDQLGLRFDGEQATRVTAALAPLEAVRLDAGLLLHDRGWAFDEVVEHTRRWALVREDRARRAVGFVATDTWRAYVATYLEGQRLVAAWLDARPEGTDLADRFGRLLDEAFTPEQLAGELVGLPA